MNSGWLFFIFVIPNLFRNLYHPTTWKTQKIGYNDIEHLSRGSCSPVGRCSLIRLLFCFSSSCIANQHLLRDAETSSAWRFGFSSFWTCFRIYFIPSLIGQGANLFRVHLSNLVFHRLYSYQFYLINP